MARLNGSAMAKPLVEAEIDMQELITTGSDAAEAAADEEEAEAPNGTGELSHLASDIPDHTDIESQEVSNGNDTQDLADLQLLQEQIENGAISVADIQGHLTRAVQGMLTPSRQSDQAQAAQSAGLLNRATRQRTAAVKGRPRAAEEATDSIMGKLKRLATTTKAQLVDSPATAANDSRKRARGDTFDVPEAETTPGKLSKIDGRKRQKMGHLTKEAAIVALDSTTAARGTRANTNAAASKTAEKQAKPVEQDRKATSAPDVTPRKRGRPPKPKAATNPTFAAAAAPLKQNEAPAPQASKRTTRARAKDDAEEEQPGLESVPPIKAAKTKAKPRPMSKSAKRLANVSNMENSAKDHDGEDAEDGADEEAEPPQVAEDVTSTPAAPQTDLPKDGDQDDTLISEIDDAAGSDEEEDREERELVRGCGDLVKGIRHGLPEIGPFRSDRRKRPESLTKSAVGIRIACRNLQRLYRDMCSDASNNTPEAREEAISQLDAVLDMAADISLERRTPPARKVLQDLYSQIIPFMAKTFLDSYDYNVHVVSKSESQEAVVPTADLRRLTRIATASLVLCEQADNWKTPSDRPDTNLNIVKSVRNFIKANLKRLLPLLQKELRRREADIAERQRRKERVAEERARNIRAIKQREEDRLNAARSERLAELDDVRLRCEPDWYRRELLHFEPPMSTSDFENADGDDDIGVDEDEQGGAERRRLDRDANGTPFERVQMFDVPHGSGAVLRDWRKHKVFKDRERWIEQQRELLAVGEGLEDFAGHPKIFQKIFRTKCMPGQPLRNAHVDDILYMAAYWKCELTAAAKRDGREVPDWVRGIPKLSDYKQGVDGLDAVTG